MSSMLPDTGEQLCCICCCIGTPSGCDRAATRHIVSGTVSTKQRDSWIQLGIPVLAGACPRECNERVRPLLIDFQRKACK